MNTNAKASDAKIHLELLKSSISILKKKERKNVHIRICHYVNKKKYINHSQILIIGVFQEDIIIMHMFL